VVNYGTVLTPTVGWHKIENMEAIPFEVIEQIIQCFGRSFHFKDTLSSFLISCGLHPSIANKYKDEYKFVWGKKLLLELNETEEGRIGIKRIITGLYQLRNLPDKEVKDKESGLSALRKFKELVKSHEIIIDNNKKTKISSKKIFLEKQKIIEQRKQRLEELKNIFYSSSISINRQKAGFSFEDVIKELFALSEIEYKKSYKSNTQQIDGYFRFEGFDYLVEAKWRKDPPPESEIGGFQRKVNTKLESTRGVFFSVNGFRKEVINQFNGEGANIIFFTGEDILLILEGRIELKEVLIRKIEKAAQFGIILIEVKQMITK